MLRITDAQRREIEALAGSGFPNEICGFLLGESLPGADSFEEGDSLGIRVVRRVRPVANAWESSPGARASLLATREEGGAPSREEWESASQERRFLIDPRDFAAADREAQAAGWTILGFYHSHPNHPAEPSKYDLEMAIPEQSYVIVSVREGQAVEFRSWVTRDFGLPFEEEAVVMSDQ